MLTEIEKLDAIGREKGLVIYSVHQCRAGWGVQWYDENAGSPNYGETWRANLSVYGYYPTIIEMIEAEKQRLAKI